MSRIGITENQVFEACEKIKREGKIPTIENIRAYLKTGSNSTISKFLKNYKNSSSSTSIIITEKGFEYHKGYGDAIKDMKNILTKLIQ